MPNALRVSVAGATLLLLILSVGCSEKLSRRKGITDAELLSIGERNASQKNYGDAAEAFQLLVERYPTSPLAARAQFGLAENRMANREELEAEVAFDDFLRLYPSDPKVPDALFLKGRLLSGQVLSPGRDQTKTHEAIRSFGQFLEKEHGTPRAAEAEAKVRQLRDRLAEHEEAVVAHYLARKKYESAESRARQALSEYPDVPSTPGLMELLARALERQGRNADAVAVRKSIREKFPAGKGVKR